MSSAKVDFWREWNTILTRYVLTHLDAAYTFDMNCLALEPSMYVDLRECPWYS